VRYPARDQTARYIDKILMRLTLAGAIYITFVCLVPEFLNARFSVPFYFGGTSLLIVSWSRWISWRRCRPT